MKDLLEENKNDIKKLYQFDKNIFHVTKYDGVYKFLTYDEDKDAVFGSTNQ